MTRRHEGKVIGRRRLVCLLALTAVLMPADGRAAPVRFKGRVVVAERIALPPGAQLEVRLVELPRGGVPAKVIAETSVPAGPSSPIGYVMTYDDALIQAGRSYALEARILDGERVVLASRVAHPFVHRGMSRTEIDVEPVPREVPPPPPAPVAAPAPLPTGPVGRWLAQDLRGGSLVADTRVVLDIAADGSLVGSAGCNAIVGRAVIADGTIGFTGLATTNMSCAPELMEQEQRLLDILVEARGLRVEQEPRRLVLLDGGGGMLAGFGAG